MLFLTVAFLSAGCGEGTPAATQELQGREEKALNVYNWIDYVGDSTIADFVARTGIRVNYDTYESNEVLETKMLTGRSGYDVVFPSGVPLARQIEAGAIGTLDKSKLPNVGNMDPFAMARLALNDSGNAHAIAYLWGTAGSATIRSRSRRCWAPAASTAGPQFSIPRSPRGWRSAASR